MFVLASALLCGGILLFFFSLLLSWDPNRHYLRTHSGMADTLALVIVTCIFGGAISLFLSFQVQAPAGTDYLIGGAILAVTVVIFKLFHIFGRLVDFSKEEETKRVIQGPFSGGTSAKMPQAGLKKAA